MERGFHGTPPDDARAAAARRRAILVLNAGSSSIKFALFPLGGDGGDRRGGVAVAAAALRGQIAGLGAQPQLTAHTADGRALAPVDLPTEDVPGGDAGAQHAAVLPRLIDWLAQHDAGGDVVAAGHRVVHGGSRFTAPVRVDADVLRELDALAPLAPLHQPHNLAPIRALAARRPALPQVACFDTAFHATVPALAQAYALPRALSAAGIRRYGFHGLSYEFIAQALPAQAGTHPWSRTIVAHLGNGASLCALRDGRSIASTMGFTAVEGLMMGTRSGSLDPGVLLHLMQHLGWNAARIERLLYRESGLLGVSGIAADMRTLLASEAPAAREAVALFCYRVVREIGSLAAALGGLDALVFTGGIGEHAAPVRAQIMDGCRWLGLVADAAANARHGPRLSAADSAVLALALATDEQRMIARHTAALLSPPMPATPAANDAAAAPALG